MKHIVLKFFVLSVLIFNLTNCRKNNPDVLYVRSYLKEIKAARKEIIFYMARNSVPGATFAVAKGGKIVYSEGMGLASKDLEVPVTRTTKFRIGELSENFTSLIYQKLIEEHILIPDSTVHFYYPEFPEKKYKIPIRHLAQHTSGIREPGSNEDDWIGLHMSIQRGIENFMNDSLIAPPGSYFLPSIFNYNLLGAVMEKVTGIHFSSLLKKYVTDTLGLENTMVDSPFKTIKGRSDYFDHNVVAQVVPSTFRDMRYRAPSEGLLSNAEDLVKFGNALLFSEYISKEMRKRLFEPLVLENGNRIKMVNGWVVLKDKNNRVVYGKSGNITGGSAAVLIYPKEELVVACATNLSSLSEDDIPVFEIANQFLLDNLPDRKQETKTQDSH